ncbi:hypothetical protein GGU45_001386 [Niabella hirudinis]
MSRLGYEYNPIVIYGHADTENYHVHIITTRIRIDGKKVPHHFEGKRANEMLNQILLTDKKQLFAAELNHCLSYSFSSIAQFRLLMEQKGYRVKTTSDHLEFFKYGSRQGTIAIQAVNAKINTEIPSDLQMKAIIRKYKDALNTHPIQSPNEKYSTAKKEYRIALTEDLYKKFGWQFVFFKNPKHDKPYGYVIIDHPKKIVHKGSAIFPLNELLSPRGEALSAPKSMSNSERTPVQHQTGTSTQEQSTPPSKKPDTINPLKVIDKVIGEAEFDAEQELHKAHDAKRKRGRYL